MDSHSLHVGATAVKVSVPYKGIELRGTGLEFTEDTKLSINETEYAQFLKGDYIYVVSRYTYTFDKDTIIKNIWLPTPAYSEIFEELSLLDVPLSASVESADIIKITNDLGAVTPITAGEVGLAFTILNQTAGTANVIVKIYKTGVLYYTFPTQVLGNGEQREIVLAIGVLATFAITDDVSFRVTCDQTATVKGTAKASRLYIRRDNF